MSMASSFCQCIGPIGHDTAFAWGVGSSQIEIIGESVIIKVYAGRKKVLLWV